MMDRQTKIFYDLAKQQTDEAAKLYYRGKELEELLRMCLEYFEDPDHAPVQPYELERRIKEALE